MIARNSSFTYKGKSVDVKQVGRDLGVRYVLEGSVRKAANRVRITVQLIDAGSGTHLWADKFDGTLDDIFDLHDQVAREVAGAVEPNLREAEINRSLRKPTTSLDAYDLYMRGLAAFRNLSPDRSARHPGADADEPSISIRASPAPSRCAPCASSTCRRARRTTPTQWRRR